MVLSMVLCLCVKMDHPSGPCWLHRPSRSEVSYMLQIILWTNRDILDCPTLLYTLSLYGNMLIIAIIAFVFTDACHCSLSLCLIVV